MRIAGEREVNEDGMHASNIHLNRRPLVQFTERVIQSHRTRQVEWQPVCVGHCRICYTMLGIKNVKPSEFRMYWYNLSGARVQCEPSADIGLFIQDSLGAETYENTMIH